MAKRNKSQAIRALLADKPAASVKEIQSLLLAKRLKVSPALIHQVKGRNGKASRNGNGVTFDQLLAAKALVARVGSVDVARKSIDALSKLID